MTSHDAVCWIARSCGRKEKPKLLRRVGKGEKSPTGRRTYSPSEQQQGNAASGCSNTLNKAQQHTSCQVDPCSPPSPPFYRPPSVWATKTRTKTLRKMYHLSRSRPRPVVAPRWRKQLLDLAPMQARRVEPVLSRASEAALMMPRNLGNLRRRNL